MKKKAIIIGLGGMGQRYYKCLKKMNFKIVGICDKKSEKVKNFITEKNIFITKDYKNLLPLKADLLCVVSNTKSRLKIVEDFAKKSKIKKIITEKPLATSFLDCQTFLSVIKNNNIRIIVNTHRTYSPNWLDVKKFFDKKSEQPTHISINSPSAGLGNMGTTFFDVAKLFYKEKAISVTSWIDKTNTINPRGSQFKDPGGYGIINFKNNKKLFFDLSENTGLPYIITIKSKNFEFSVDELNNKFILKSRPKIMHKKPLYYYLFKPVEKKIKLKHKFDVVNMTMNTVKKIFEKKYSHTNIKNSIEIMEWIFACFISSKNKKIIQLPLNKKYHKFKINFA